jgi:predicted nucleic acid-binding protein
VSAVFIDTSAIYALLVREDGQHERAKAALKGLQTENVGLVSTSFVVHESVALLQSRIGLSAVRTLHELIVPALDIEWIGVEHYTRAMLSLLSANRRDLSLADWTSFDAMRRRGVDRALAFDPHFAEQGFTVVPEAEVERP